MIAGTLEDKIPLGWPLSEREGSVRRTFAAGRAASASRYFLDHKGAIGYSGSAHLLSIARTGAGKGVSTIIPALLSYRGPVIVIDPKGENFLVTSRWRRDNFGQTVYAIDPFRELDKHSEAAGPDRFHGLNIFDPILTKSQAIDKADSVSLSRMISSVDPLQSKDPFWDNSAQDLLAAIIHLVLTSKDIPDVHRTLSTVISIAGKGDLARYLEMIVNRADVDYTTVRSFIKFIGDAESVRQSIKSVMYSYLSVFDSVSLKEALSSSTVDMNQVKRGEDFTIYIVMPPSKLMSHARVLRMIVGALLGKIIQRNRIPPSKTLFLLDECAQLGTFDELRQAVTLLRGFGLQVWMFFQDLSQVERLYSDWRTLVNNCGVVQVFGMSRKSESGRIAEILNDIEPDGISKLDKRQQILSIEGEPDQVCGLMNYLTDPAYSGKWDPNPYYK